MACSRFDLRTASYSQSSCSIQRLFLTGSSSNGFVSLYRCQPRRPSPLKLTMTAKRGNASVTASSSLAQASDVLQFSATLNTNLALKQIPEATFDDYINNQERIFKAFFPDADRCEQLSEDTYRIFMLPISFIVATAYPVVDMRVFLDNPCPTTDNVKDPSSVKKVIRLQAANWELRGVDYDPSAFSLDLRGSLFSQTTNNPKVAAALAGISSSSSSNRATSSSGVSYSASSSATSSSFSSSSLSASTSGLAVDVRGGKGGGVPSATLLRGKMTITVGMLVPESMQLIPREAVSEIGSAVLSRLLSGMKDRVNNRVLKDYAKFMADRKAGRA